MSAQDRRDGPLGERLADWVDDRLPPHERAEFEAWLAEDPSLQAEADEYRRTVDAVRGALRHGPHAPRDFAARVLEAAASSEPVAQDAARARRFAWVGSAAAAAVFVLVFFVVQRLNRAEPSAEELALSAAPEMAGRAQQDLGFEGFVDATPDEGGDARSRFAVGMAEPEALEIEAFLGGGVEPSAPVAGGGGGRSGGVGLGGGAGPAGPSSPGPAGPTAPAPRSARPGADGPSAGTNDLFFRSAPVPDAGPIGALVYVVSWQASPPREQAAGSDKEAPRPEVVREPPSDPGTWFRSTLSSMPVQDNVIVLPADLVPLDLGPARLALGAVSEEEGDRNPGEYWPAAGDLAFRVEGDEAQRVRALRALLRSARERGATLGLQRSRFRRLDLRAEDEASGADVALVLRGLAPAEAPAAKKGR